MDGKTVAKPRQDRALVTAEEWFGGGKRRWYDPASARLLSDEQGEARAGLIKVFGRTTGVASPDAVWLTMLPGFPEGSYGWAQVDRLLPAGLGPRLYVEPVGQGDSDKPNGYAYSTVERADLIGAWWRHHDVRRTVVVTFDYTSLALLELLRRQLERPGGPVITAALMVNGGLFADSHSHPWRGTPLLGSPLGVLVAKGAQKSPVVFAQGFKQAQMYSRGNEPSDAEIAETWSALARRDGAKFLHEGAGFVKEHRRNAGRWDLAAIARELNGSVALTVGGSTEDPYEHRQVDATRERVPEADIITFPGGHLTTTEQPALLANAITRVATRHGVKEALV
ncbi:alpha/beta fold hydrolase [Kribbella jiaozuonensis]|uniref:Alpha/beta hydrolase n=1 Tax=Kribbella jiaozuonensis TaxID=2575441 RepID=A0A4U3LYK7_9ACTN|nr:alpha/beta hydrolase [Kribbella jiaozuonensis]TKK80504.1 alpha/beta hydrolase [Kribbella jiaozuonensis]